MTRRIMIFVEDPGAATFVIGLPTALRRMGAVAGELFAAGHAVDVLDAAGEPAHRLSDRADALWAFDQFGPDVVAVGTAESPVAIGLSLIERCRSSAATSIGLVDGPTNPEHRFSAGSPNPLHHLPDRLVVPDAATKDRFVALGVPISRVSTCGHPLYDRARAARRDETARRSLRQRLWPEAQDRQILLFLAELSTGLVPDAFHRTAEYTLTGTSGSDCRTDIVAEEVIFATGKSSPAPFRVLRPHPKMTPADSASYAGAFDAVNTTGPVADAIEAADVVVGLTSVALDEALLLGRPVVAVVPRSQERDWLLGAHLGLVPVATTREEIAAHLAAAFAGALPDPAVIDRLLPRGATTAIARVLATAYSDRAA